VPDSRQPADDAQLDDFGRFYEATYQLAYRTALAILDDQALAADVVQDAYLAAFRGRTRFRGDAAPRTWLLRIVVNAAIDALNRRRRLRSMPLVREVLPIPGPEGVVLDRVAIDRALAALQPRQRAAIVLRYLLGMDYATIAQVLGTTTGNVGVILTRSLDGLRDSLSEPEHRASMRRRAADG
jgi:RNA polymerase sigma-70 factor (ECF subfamily)